MSLEHSQDITESKQDTRAAVLFRPEVIARRNRRGKAWRKKNRAKMLKILADARAKYSAQRAKKRARVSGTPTQQSDTSISVSKETAALFAHFKNNAASADFALRTLLHTVKGKKLVAKPVAVEYTVE